MLLSAFALLLLAACGQSAPRSRPNILLIITDDQRYGTVGPYMPETQARIFDQGVTFTNGFVTTPLCCPSRASILTGMYAHSTGVHDNPDPLLNKTTFVERLKSAGYHTGIVGKYLNSWDFRQPRPEFDYWVSDAPGGNEYFNASLNVNGQNTVATSYITEALQQYALDFLDDATKRKQPFLLYFAPNAPHLPSLPAPQDAQLYPHLSPYRPPSYNEPDVSDKPRWFSTRPPLTGLQRTRVDQIRLGQLRSLKAVDRAVAAMLELLQQRGQLDNTVIFFISDNGYFWGEHRLANKLFAYEESARVPFAIRYPTLVPSKTVNDQLVANIDIAPTIYELTGLKTPHEVEGRSLVSLLKGKSSWRTELLLEAWRGSYHYSAVHTDHLVYVETDGDLPELYDLAKDPYELDNRVKDPAYASVVSDLRKRLSRLVGKPLVTPSLTPQTPFSAPTGSDTE